MKKAPKLVVPKISDKATGNELDSLREYVEEAEAVDTLTRQVGWGIIERDLHAYKQEIGSKIAYLDPSSKEFNEARILYLAADKLLGLFNDYAENKKRALELLAKIDNQGEHIVLDVDNGV